MKTVTIREKKKKKEEEKDYRIDRIWEITLAVMTTPFKEAET